MYRYQIKKGFENRTYAHCRRVSENEVESDELLNSSYLELIEDKDQTQMTATPNPVPAPQQTPNANLQNGEQTANKEAEL